MSRLALAATLALTLATTLAADSASSALRVGATVTRRCAVSTGASVEVQCTRAGAVVRAAIDGRMLPPTPLRLSGPGTTAVSIPLDTRGGTARVVTILF